MTRRATISIPQPCHENWNAMTPTEKGRFCASCQKKVYDFTNSSDREILKQFTAEPNLCGRFNKSQLDRELFVPREKSSVWAAAATVVMATLSASTPVSAQQTQTELSANNENHVKGKVAVTSGTDPMRKVMGEVYDQSGTLPGASVKVKNTQRLTQTDIDGKYEIDAQIGDTIVISFVGFRDREFVVNENKFVNVTMLEMADVTMLGGPMFVTKRTWFGQFFVWTANLFREEENKRSVKFR